MAGFIDKRPRCIQYKNKYYIARGKLITFQIKIPASILKLISIFNIYYRIKYCINKLM